VRLRVGVIGGTGLYDWGPGERVEVETEYGPVDVTHHRRPKADVFFLPRHGGGHEVPAHRVDARPLVRALAAAHVDYVVAFFNVGALDATLRPGQWLVPADLIDGTHARPRTFHDERAVHVDLARPFCPHARAALVAAAPPGTRDGGVYATTDGPRFETAAESRLLRAAGADVVGMTAGPEAALAREAGLCYAGVAFVANASGRPLASTKDLQRRLALQAPAARSWVERTIPRLPARKRCDCATAAARGTLATPTGARA
jgi:purine nucleoside phosphorylase